MANRSKARRSSRIGLHHVPSDVQRIIAAAVRENGLSATSRRYDIPRDAVDAASRNEAMREGTVLVICSRIHAAHPDLKPKLTSASSAA